MLKIDGLFELDTLNEITNYTQLRFKDSTIFEQPEAFSIYELNLMPPDTLLSLCEENAGEDLYIPVESYVPRDIVEYFKKTELIPVSWSPMLKSVTCVALRELNNSWPQTDKFTVDIQHVPIYHYLSMAIKVYGKSKYLSPVPSKQLFDGIINEAIDMGASDITISTSGYSADVYYNVRKKKVYSNRVLSFENVEEIIRMLCFESPMDNVSRLPKNVGVSLNDEYRGRVIINYKYHGYAITIRILPNATFSNKLTDLGLSKETIGFMRNVMMNREFGLRIIAGATMSGKNTTSLAYLNELNANDIFKVVSIEMPVEQILEGIEQINCDTKQEYVANINSLIRQNPDFIYITEIGDDIAESIMKITNTGKRVLSTIHANSCEDVVGRMQDLTGLPLDKIIQSLHSIVYQELVRNEETDTVKPRNKYVYLSNDRKNMLYGKSFGEIVTTIRGWSGGDIW